MIDFCSYNIRGLHNKVSFAKDFIKFNNISLVALLETHVKKENADFYSRAIAPDFEWIFNYESHYNGRIWLGWNKSEWKVQSFCSTAQHITCNIQKLDGSLNFNLTAVYAFNSVDDRRLLWNDLLELCSAPSFVDHPWCAIGDFNIFLHDYETNRGMPRRCRAIMDFQNCVSDLGMADLKSLGPVFTWWDGNVEHPLLRKLDRALVNGSWLQQFSESFVEILPRGLSDHNPVALSFGGIRERVLKPFQVFNHIIEHEKFLDVVSEAWNLATVGHPWQVLMSKLKAVKVALKQLNISTGNLHCKVVDARNELLNFQSSLPSVPSSSQRLQERSLCDTLAKALGSEEKILHQKSRINWLKRGDGNNKFFFHSCRGRWNSNKIVRLEDDSGITHTGHMNISNVAVSYFKNLLGSCHSTQSFPDDIQTNQLSDDHHTNLTQPFTASDVLSTMKSLGKNKSPGPNGFTPEFYLKAWPVVGNDVTRAVLYFFDTGFLPRAFNSSAITLVAKQSNATSMQQFRPISCCNTIYKCIAKMLAFRMKPVMQILTSQNQGAFVPNRSIGDNVQLAQSLCKDYHLSSGPPKFACKLDLKKAFDSISWAFILETLKRMNFPDIFISWIRTCICDCMHSVKINGSLEGYFKAGSGLRQGCPLSPYLFVLSMEVLNACISKVISRGDFHYHWRAKNIDLTHLVFADDLLLFCKGECDSIKLLFEGVQLFSNISGMKPNPSKCTCFFGNVDRFTMLYALHITQFSEGSLPIYYLGLPLISGTLKAQHCNLLISKFTRNY